MGACVVERDLSIVHWNQTLVDWTGLSRPAAIGSNLGVLAPDLLMPKYHVRMMEVFDSGTPAVFSSAIHKRFLPAPSRHGTHEELMVQQTSVRLLTDGSGLALITIQDVTSEYQQLRALRQERTQLARLHEENRKTIAALDESESRVRGILETAADGIVTIDEAGTIDSCNGAAARMFGYAAGEVLGRNIALLLPGAGGAGGPAQDFQGVREVRGRRSDGRTFPLEPAVSALVVGDGRRKFTLILRDLTERKQAESALRQAHDELARQNAKLADLASVDELTRVKNRRRFQEDMDIFFSISVRKGTPLSLVMLDVDHFKQYNDTFGHPAGDEVLRAVAGLLREATREHDVAARYGGEEFVVLLPSTSADDAMVMAERLRDRIERVPWALRKVTASLGVATTAGDIPTGAALVEAADHALYRSKRAGRNRVTHHRHAVAVPAE
jgi:diguanylate cyclase (GGDEF)-like protein